MSGSAVPEPGRGRARIVRTCRRCGQLLMRDAHGDWLHVTLTGPDCAER